MRDYGMRARGGAEANYLGFYMEVLGPLLLLFERHAFETAATWPTLSVKMIAAVPSDRFLLRV